MENLSADLLDLINKAKKIRQQQRDASRKYYNTKYKISEGMSDEEKASINENIARRKEIYKAKYEANKELYKQRAKEYRLYLKTISMEDDTTTEQ